MTDVTTNRQRDFHYLIQTYGEAGARDVFEKLCTALFQTKYGPEAHNIRVHQGDGGIDVMVGDFSSPIRNFQCKFFLEKAAWTNQILDDSRKGNIRDSFRQARKNKNYTMSEWILCVPCILSQDDMSWWSKWKEEMEDLTDISISLFDGDYLLNELKKYGLYDSAFGIDLSNKLDDILNILSSQTKDHEKNALCRDRIGYIATILDADAVAKAEAEYTEADAGKFYMVDLNFPLMLRIVCAGQDVPHEDMNDRLLELCDSNTPTILTGNSGTGKSTILLRAAVNWVRSGGIALWLSPAEDFELSESQAGQFYEDVLRFVPQNQRALLCLDNPSQWPIAFRALANKWPGNDRLQLLLAERSNRLTKMTDSNGDLLHHWFDGAVVAALMDKPEKRPLRVKNYPVEYIPESYLRKRGILTRSVDAMRQIGDVKRFSGKDAVTETMSKYGTDNEKNAGEISLVELIYRAQFRLLDFASKPEKLRLDWDEWRHILRKELKLKEDAATLYGVIALCNFFGCPITRTRYYQFFDLGRYDLISVMKKWRLEKNVEPVLLREQDDDYILLPKHDVIAELFFQFNRETLPVNDLMVDLLNTMDELEIEEFLKNIVSKGSIQNGYLYPLGKIRYRNYFTAIYNRTQDGFFGLSPEAKAHLALGLIYTVPKNNRNLGEQTLSMLNTLGLYIDDTVLTASLYTEWGRLLAKQEKSKAAEEKFRAVLKADPQNIHSRTELGRLLAKQPGKAAEAERILREAMQIDKNHIQSRTELGRLLVNWKGREGEAEQLYHEILRIKPKDISSRTELGRLMVKQGKITEAEAFFREAIQIDPKNLHPHTELGRLLAKQPGRKHEAEQFLLETLEIDPNHIHSRTELGRLLAKQGRDAEAEKFLREAIRIEPNSLHCRVELAKLCTRNNRHAEAERLYQEVLKIDPGNIYAKDGLNKLLGATPPTP